MVAKNFYYFVFHQSMYSFDALDPDYGTAIRLVPISFGLTIFPILSLVFLCFRADPMDRVLIIERDSMILNHFLYQMIRFVLMRAHNLDILILFPVEIRKIIISSTDLLFITFDYLHEYCSDLL